MANERQRDRRVLGAALAATSLFLFAEVAGGLLTNSLALLADAAHMLADVGALGMSLFAVWLAGRPATDTKTYGYYRAEILAAFLNGVILWFAVAGILYEAYRRYGNPVQVHGAGMLLVAVLGLAVNLFCAFLLAGRRGGSLNVRAAYWHVLSDLLGSLGAIVAAVLILVTGWVQADALVSVLIAALILAGSISLVREAADVLMEAVPAHIDMEELRKALLGVPGTADIHDLHVWTVTTGHHALSAHAVVDGTVSEDRILDTIQHLLAERFSIDHVTVQLERRNRAAQEPAHF